MKFLSKTNSLAFLSTEEGKKIKKFREISENLAEHAKRIEPELYYENNFYKRLNFCCEKLKCEKVGLFFDEIGIWSFSNDKYLQKVIWEYHGYSNAVEFPGILFQRLDFEKIASFANFGFLCGWDVLVYIGREDWIYVSHDGWYFDKNEVDARI